MRAVIQRVRQAQVMVAGSTTGSIGHGLLALVCAMKGDEPKDAEFIARKLASLRIFPDEMGKMNRSVTDVGGGVLLVSQFTLSADTTSGTRPSFSSSMDPDGAEDLLRDVENALRDLSLVVVTGSFGDYMQIELVNDGPVTISLDSRAKVRK